MKTIAAIEQKIVDSKMLSQWVAAWKLKGHKVVFTNGVFDMLHQGHLASLNQAAKAGDKLIVAVNADAGVKKLKGPDRPIYDQQTRAYMLASLMVTDAIIIFEEDTPLQLIKLLLPDVLVKGGDYKIEDIAGAREVLDNGGEVILANMVAGVSTTENIKRIKS